MKFCFILVNKITLQQNNMGAVADPWGAIGAIALPRMDRLIVQYHSLHTTSTSDAKLNIFLARTQTRNTTQSAPEHDISSQKSILLFWGGGTAPSPDPFPLGGIHPSPHLTPPRYVHLLDPPLHVRGIY